MLLLYSNAGAKGKLGAFGDRDPPPPPSCFPYQERLMNWATVAIGLLDLTQQEEPSMKVVQVIS